MEHIGIEGEKEKEKGREREREREREPERPGRHSSRVCDEFMRFLHSI